MKNNQMIYVILFCCLVSVAGAQTGVKLNPEAGGRISAGADKIITRGLHVSLEEEIRLDNNFKSLDKLGSTLAFKYKVHNNVKLGLAYVLIAPYKSSAKEFGGLRHRLYFDIKGSIKRGNWNISLMERFQWTYRMGDMNLYQNPRNMLSLKSRISVKYKINSVLAPYFYVEMRNVLNAPTIAAHFNGEVYLNEEGEEEGDPGWFLKGYKGCYINRIRSAIGIDFKFYYSQKVGVYFFADYLNNKKVDANSAGTKLKSYTRETGFMATLGVSYVYVF